MNHNRYYAKWLPALGLHALHQVEESISFFQWYLDHETDIPRWLLIVSGEHAAMLVRRPELFVAATVAQLLAVSALAFAFRRNERSTKFLLVFYLLGLVCFLAWHVMTSYAVHSYPPVMVTCVGGLFLIPRWLYEIFVLSKESHRRSEAT